MRHLWQLFITFRTRNQSYFSRCKAQVAENNLRLLRITLCLLLPFFFCYGAWTTATLRNPVLIFCYAAIFVLLFILLLLTGHFQRHMPPPEAVQAACAVCVCMLMGFIIAISIFPFPEDPPIFYSLAYIIVASLFTFSYWQIMAVMSSITAAYLFLSALFRSESAAYLDRFCAVTTWLCTSLFLLLITDLRLRNGETQLLLEEASRTDSLTGLSNRRGAQLQMHSKFAQCRRSQQPVAVMMADVNHFKSYNDALGHPAGDDCLQAIGELIHSFSEEHGLFAARYGGEEFLLLLPDTTEDTARKLSGEFLERVRQKALPGPYGIVTVSIGTAVLPAASSGTLEGLIQQADEALYSSKTAGRDRATVICVRGG